MTDNYVLQEPHGTLTIYESGREGRARRQVRTRTRPNDKEDEFTKVDEDDFNG